MIKQIRKLRQPILWRLYKWYLSSPRWYIYKDIKVRLLPTVFHPGWLVSTMTLIDYLTNFDWNGKTVLELGAGSGLISLVVAKNGAIVTASDINPKATEALKQSAQINNLKISIIESDLFNDIKRQPFDYILLNPPYFPKDPIDYWERAFFCGSNFEYFHSLFYQIHDYMSESTKAFMILNEYCHLEAIHTIATKHNIDLKKVYTHKRSGEKQFIFEIEENK